MKIVGNACIGIDSSDHSWINHLFTTQYKYKDYLPNKVSNFYAIDVERYNDSLSRLLRKDRISKIHFDGNQFKESNWYYRLNDNEAHFMVKLIVDTDSKKLSIHFAGHEFTVNDIKLRGFKYNLAVSFERTFTV